MNLPLDYWLEWLHHWLAERDERRASLRASRARRPRCRRGRSAGGPSAEYGDVAGRAGTAVWALASAFLVGGVRLGHDDPPRACHRAACDRGHGLRVGFAERETVAPLAIAALLVPSRSPRTTPESSRWLLCSRSRPASCGGRARGSRPPAALVIASVSWCAVTRVRRLRRRPPARRRADDIAPTASLRRGATSSTGTCSLNVFRMPRRSVARPWRLSRSACSRSSRGAKTGRCSDLPATMLAVALALLVLTPSKLPWHFGALTGLAALTIGAEVARIRRDGSDSRGWQIRAYLITGASIVATYLGVVSPRFLESVRSPHAHLDTWPRRGFFLHHSCPRDSGRRCHGGDGHERPTQRTVHGRADRMASRHGRFRSRVVPMICFTVGVLADDSRRTVGWTLTKQNTARSSGVGVVGWPTTWLFRLPARRARFSSVGSAMSSMPPGIGSGRTRSRPRTVRPLAVQAGQRHGSDFPRTGTFGVFAAAFGGDRRAARARMGPPGRRGTGPRAPHRRARGRRAADRDDSVDVRRGLGTAGARTGGERGPG